MKKVIYFVGDNRVFSFNSDGIFFYRIKEILTKNSFKVLTQDFKNKFSCEIADIIDDILCKRNNNNNQVSKSITTYNVLYNDKILKLGRNELDQEIMIYVSLFDFIHQSKKIDVIELPCFTEYENNLLNKLKTENLSVKNIDSKILKKFISLKLININNDHANLNDGFKKIIFH